MSRESFGKPDAWKLARPVWGWGRGATPRPTPRDGFCIWYKRLERGVFEMPTSDQTGVELDYRQLSRLLGGLDLRSGRRRQRRYRRVVNNSGHNGLP